MAATTIATILAQLDSKTQAEIMYNAVYQSDRLAAVIPLMDKGALQWQAWVESEPAGGAGRLFRGQMTDSASTGVMQPKFLTSLYKRDSLSAAEAATRANATNGPDADASAAARVLGGLSNHYREMLYDGNQATVAIGATLTTAGITAVEVGPNHTTLALREAATTGLGYLRYTQSTDTIEYMAPGDSTYGTGVVLSATNFYRVPLISGNGISWIRMTCVFATLHAYGDITTTAAASGLTYTPASEPTGLVTMIHPSCQWYGNLSQANPTAAGDALSQEGLTMLASHLLNQSNDDPSKCIITMNKVVWVGAQKMITALGGGTSAVEFMGTTFNSPRFMGIPVVWSKFNKADKTSSSGAVTTLSDVHGWVLGEEDGAYVGYLDESQAVEDSVGQNMFGPLVADSTGGLVRSPIWYRTHTDAVDYGIKTHAASMCIEPAFAKIMCGGSLLGITQ
jgi:hypothetical protein